MSKRLFGVVFAVGILTGAGSSWAQNAAEGKKLYTSYCSTCHGETGKGDGMAAASLPAKPADHTNGAVMNQLNDKFPPEHRSNRGCDAGTTTIMHYCEAVVDETQNRA